MENVKLSLAIGLLALFSFKAGAEENANSAFQMGDRFDRSLMEYNRKRAKNLERLSHFAEEELDYGSVPIDFQLRLHSNEEMEIELLTLSVEGQALFQTAFPKTEGNSDFQWHSFHTDKVPMGLRFLDLEVQTKIEGLITPLAEFPPCQKLQATVQLNFNSHMASVLLLASVVDQGGVHPNFQLKLKASPLERDSPK